MGKVFKEVSYIYFALKTEIMNHDFHFQPKHLQLLYTGVFDIMSLHLDRLIRSVGDKCARC